MLCESCKKQRCASCGRPMYSTEENYEVTIKHHNYKGGPPPAQLGLTAPPTNEEVVYEGTARSLTDALGKRAVTKHWREWSGGGLKSGRHKVFRVSTKDDPKMSGGAYHELLIKKMDGTFTKEEVRELRSKFD